MRIDTERRSNDVVVAHISGEIDLLSAPELRRWIQENAAPPQRLILELDGVAFLGSAGLSVLAELSEQNDHNALPWAIVATERVVLRPLEATGLVTQLAVYEKVDTAVHALADSTE